MNNENDAPLINGRAYPISISIQGHWNVIHIGKGVVSALGMPAYICLRISETNDSIAISPCDASEVLSFKTPDKLMEPKSTKFRIHSQQFVQSILLANGLDIEKTYQLKGTYSKKNNTAVFRFNCTQKGE